MLEAEEKDAEAVCAFGPFAAEKPILPLPPAGSGCAHPRKEDKP